MTSILQPWVTKLGLRHQGVLMASVRGCDSVPKDDPSKALVRSLRGILLRSFDPNPSSFIEHVGKDDEVLHRMRPVLKSFDHYPIHYLLHLMHAAEIVGYHWPDPLSRHWQWFYYEMCRKMHVNPETKEELDARLGADESEFARRAA